MREITIYRTAFFDDARLVEKELRKMGISCYKWMENSLGVEVGFPSAPPINPGLHFLIKVDRENVDRALEKVKTLPVSHEKSPDPFIIEKHKAALRKTYTKIIIASAAILAALTFFGLVF